MQAYWLVTFIWVFLLVSGYSNKGNAERYISKSYFHKHSSLIDSKFKDFILNELPLSLCKEVHDNPKFAPRVLDLDRRLIGEGSHRRLSSSITFDFGSGLAHQLHGCSWDAIIIERLPSGVFADPFELQHLVQRRVFDDAAVFGDTNLELPSFKSNRSVVEIHKKIDISMARDKDELDIHIHLPLHARYAPLGHGFSRVEFGVPDLFVRCRHEADALNESCVMSTKHNAETRLLDVVWEVPSGIKEHASFVSAVTFISAIVSALVIVHTSIYNSRTADYYEVKHS